MHLCLCHAWASCSAHPSQDLGSNRPTYKSLLSIIGRANLQFFYQAGSISATTDKHTPFFGWKENLQSLFFGITLPPLFAFGKGNTTTKVFYTRLWLAAFPDILQLWQSLPKESTRTAIKPNNKTISTWQLCLQPGWKANSEGLVMSEVIFLKRSTDTKRSKLLSENFCHQIPTYYLKYMIVIYFYGIWEKTFTIGSSV